MPGAVNVVPVSVPGRCWDGCVLQEKGGDVAAVEAKCEGLWAYYQGRFYGLYFNEQNRELDHVTWFRDIGLADYGPEFDRIIRGRMALEGEQAVLSWYGLPRVPNHVYDLVCKYFETNDRMVVERIAYSDWA